MAKIPLMQSLLTQLQLVLGEEACLNQAGVNSAYPITVYSIISGQDDISMSSFDSSTCTYTVSISVFDTVFSNTLAEMDVVDSAMKGQSWTSLVQLNGATSYGPKWNIEDKEWQFIKDYRITIAQEETVYGD